MASTACSKARLQQLHLLFVPSSPLTSSYRGRPSSSSSGLSLAVTTTTMWWSQSTHFASVSLLRGFLTDWVSLFWHCGAAAAASIFAGHAARTALRRAAEGHEPDRAVGSLSRPRSLARFTCRSRLCSILKGLFPPAPSRIADATGASLG
ncbi:hypothetical protein BZA70DRAFT_287468 [Myxozyma melibiosi]|uniref:Uncharacterized protein n=1 Tax=Myxozyma melibiosi TaxID=54550 RepID=A0ABR1FE67_9ASCO